MEDLTLSFVSVRLRKICSKRVLRLVATLSNSTIAEADVQKLETWLTQFYRHVDATNTPFCVVYVFDTTIDNAEVVRRLCTVLGSERDITRRLSVTTCVVAPSLLAFVAQMALSAYAAKGVVHFADTLDDAKETCLNEANTMYKK